MAHGQANAEIVSDGSPSLTRNREAPILFQQNQRNEVRDMGNAAGALNAEPGMHSQNFVIPPLCANGGVTSSPTMNKNNTDLDFLIPTVWEMSHANEVIRENGEIVPTLQSRMGTGGNQVPMVTMVNTANSGANQNNAKIGTVMDTLDTWASVAGQQPTGVRRLTPLECERLQGFPDGWTDGQSDSARYKQLGNAVAIPPVEWLMRRIKRVDEQV